MKSVHTSLLLLIALCGSVDLLRCRQEDPNVGLERPGRNSIEDERLANVYKALDGQWEGRFSVYEDPLGWKEGQPQPEIDPSFDPAEAGFRLANEIEVWQEYISEGPYFQRVLIRDRYVDDNGMQRMVESHGVNKIQNGKMWCVVQKPDETVIHQGQKVDENTIIWRRQEDTPTRIESFRETVADDVYTVVGWGYYEGTEVRYGPRVWFKGVYKKRSR